MTASPTDPWAALEEALRNAPSGPPPGPGDLISRQEVADAARATAGDYDLIGTHEADVLSRAFTKFAEKIEALP